MRDRYLACGTRQRIGECIDNEVTQAFSSSTLLLQGDLIYNAKQQTTFNIGRIVSNRESCND